MDELFGAPITSVAAVLAVIFLIMASFLLYITIRNAILVRMAIRSVIRRPGRTVLIIVGLMLATAIISASFTTGDSVAFSIKRAATDSLRSLDEFIRVDENSEVWEGTSVPEEFSQAVFEEIGPILESDPDIDGVLPALVEQVAAINVRSQQFELGALLTGVDPVRAASFDILLDQNGNPIDLTSLGPNELYIDADGAGELDAQVGDTLGLALGPGELQQMTIKGIVDGWYFKRQNTNVVFILPLARTQELLDREGMLSSILISNRGDEFTGASLTPDILERHGELQALKERGLEIFAVKSEVIDEANEIGNLFVSFFTTFGLFSIGVGLLLIFLIFSMLAAERKAEMGMSRAVGMQRRHLVRMFMVEGAIYGIGSALVGAVIGIGLGFVLVIVSASIFSQDPNDNFNLIAHVEPTSVLVSFLLGTVVTFVTVIFASRRTSRLNIVRAIRDIPEPRLARAGRATLIWGIIITILGVFILFSGFQSAQLSTFSLGVSLIPIGIAMVLRWGGVSQRLVLSGTGLVLLVYWLLPVSVLDRIRDDWSQDFTIFFLSGAMVVAGAVLVTINNSRIVLGIMTNTFGRVRRFTPTVKSAVSYPLRYGFRTGLSVAMFAVVIFSVTVMATLLEGFDRLFDDQERLAGGYDVIAFAQSDLNPIADLTPIVDSNPDLSFIARENGSPSVGTFRTITLADGELPENAAEGTFSDTVITGVDDDFIASNRFPIKLATAEYANGSGFDSAAIWRALRDNSGYAIVNSFMVPTRNGFAFDTSSDSFKLTEVEGLFLENDVMEPVEVVVRDLESGTSIPLTVIGVLDDFASQGPVPGGIFTSTNTLREHLPPGREVNATQFFFNVDGELDGAANKIEAALFQHGVETLDVAETINTVQASQRAFFNLLIAFMTLGLVVGIAALGVISARAVVERRHEIGVMRAIGFSRRMVQASFLAESSFIGLLGITLGLGLGVLTSINVIADTRTDEPNIQLIIPWLKIIGIGVGGYLFALLTTYLPSAQAARTLPAEALRYE